MKKILSVLAIMLAVVALVSCNVKPKQPPKPAEKPFVTQTKKNMYKWIDKNAINPEDFKVSNLKVVWATDSLCVINFRAIGENGFGGHVRKEYQYFNIKVDGVLWEFVDDDRYENGVLNSAKDGLKYDMMFYKKDKTYLRLLKNKTKAGKIFLNAYADRYNDATGVLKSGNIIDDNIEVADTVR